jgi:hypothetical protein
MLLLCGAGSDRCKRYGEGSNHSHWQKVFHYVCPRDFYGALRCHYAHFL